MRRPFKIFSVLFALMTLIGIITVSALANNEEAESAPPDGYYFEIYDPNTNTLKKYKDPALFANAATGAPNNSVIRLLWDIEVDYLIRGDGGSNWMVFSGGTAASPKTYNVDFNGRYFSFVKCASGGYAVSMNVGSYTTVNMYSSKEGGRLYNYHTKNSSGPNALFWLRDNYATLNFGEATVGEPEYKSVTLKKSDTGYDTYNVEIESTESVTHPGDNFSAFGSALVGIVDNGSNDKNVRFNINGGTYCQIGSAAHFIHFTSNEEEQSAITVKNATLVSLENKNVFNASADATGSASFENCVLYANSTILSATSNDMRFSFTDCLFIGNIGNISASAEVNSCKFTQDATHVTGGTVAKLYEEKLLFLPSHNFSFDSDGYVKPSSYIPITEKTNVSVIYGTAGEGEWAEITWDAEDVLGKGEKRTEKWFLGQIPYSPFAIPERTDIYKFSYGAISKVTEDKTYTLRPQAAFSAKANLTLSSKLTYNVYIPKSAYGSVKSVKLNGAAYTPTLTSLDGDKYYLVSYDISVASPDEIFTVELEIVGYESKLFTQSYKFSISEYIDRVLASSPTLEARALVNSTSNYVNAYYNYVTNSNEKAVTAEQYAGKAYDTSAVSGVVTDAALILDNSICFIFALNSGAKNQAADFTVQSSGGNKTFTAGKEDFKKGFYIIELPAKDLMLDIDISVTLDSGDTASALYNIDSYIHSVHKTMPESIHLRTLVNAIAAYGKAASAYAKTDGNGTPAVSFEINGKALNATDYAVIAESEAEKEAARILISAIKEKTGVELKFSEEISGYTNTVRFISAEPHPVYDCNITTENNNLIISCAYPSFVSLATRYFIDDYISSAEKNISLGSDFSERYNTSKIYYSDFGAKGDGVTDDFFAMKAAHDTANLFSRYTVCADDGKTYYIHETRLGSEIDGYGSVQSITIKTNVNWGNANFIIDDTDLSGFDGTGRTGKTIFNVVRDTPILTVTEKEILDSVLDAGLGRDTKKIDLGLDRAVMIIPYNSSHKVYRRKGYGSFLGGNMHEVILIDKDGNVSDETPIMFDYETLNYIEVYSLDDARLTIEGGTFTTRASHVDIVYYDENGNQAFHDAYINRGMSIQRSYTTVKNVKHYVTGEISLSEQKQGMIGHAYSGFFSASNANEVAFENCVLTGKRCYTKPVGGTTGTYDFSANTVNKIVLKNCVQSNFWISVDEEGNITPATEDTPGVQLSMGTSALTGKKMHWGCGGTNYCKNMEYIGSTISRFDAHSGLYNGKIIDSTVNYIALTGVGDMIIENSRWFAEAPSYNSNSLLHLRSDYGSTWEGTVTVKDVEAYVFTSFDTYLVMHTYSNWYFGYQSCFPSLDISNLDYYNISTREPLPAEYPVYLCKTSVTAEPALHLPETQKTAPYYPDVDSDKDGFVDGTDIAYDAKVENGGVQVKSSRVNLNPIKPPEFIKITRNDGVNGKGGYAFIVTDTSKYGASDGGYYDSVENNGGFFGDTKFYYGYWSDDYYVGTNHVGENTKTFIFK